MRNSHLLQTEKLSTFDGECILVKGVSLEHIPGLEESQVIYTQPCASVKGKINCELRFSIPGKGITDNFFEFSIMSQILSTYTDKFAETRVSSNLGIARIQWRDKKIIISKNGRVIIRECDNEQDAKITINFLTKLLAPSITCTKCGSPLVDCAIAYCGKCSNAQVSLTILPNNSLLKEEIQRLRSLTEILNEIHNSPIENVEIKETLDSFESLSIQCYHVSQIALDIIVQSGSREELAVAILILHCAWDLSQIIYVLDRSNLQKICNDKNTLCLQMLNLLGSWLVALRGTIDGIMDKVEAKRSIERWLHFREARNKFYKKVELNPQFKNVLAIFAER